MQITIHDNQMNRVGFLSNEVPGVPSFFNDNWHRYLAEGASTFNFSVNKFKNGALQDYCQFLNDQAYISFTYEGEDFLFSVLTSEETDDVITLNTATLNLELRNEQANPLVNSASHNLQWYFDKMQLISGAQITVGINEVAGLTRTISYDGQETKLSRLLSVIGNFEAEFEFVTELNDDGTLKGVTLNIYKANDGASIQGVGTWRNDVTLYFGKNVTEVRRTVDRTQIFNATNVTGADGLNWNNSEWSVKNADGVEEFYKRKGSTLAFAPLSAELYPSQIQSATGDIWIRKDFETEYKSVNEMWGYALSQLKKYAYALVTYEVSAKSQLVSQAVGDGKPLSIGDTVRIQDENFNAQTGGLILQARVSELEISFSNPINNKLTFSNYIELESGISDDLEARLAQLIKDNTPYRSEITSTNGIQFKNSTGTTDLTAHIYFGSDTIETIADGYEWSKDGTVVANVQTITVDASGVNDKAVYSFKATIGDKVVGTQSVTITNVNDGAKGAQGPQGPQGNTGATGPQGPTGPSGIDGNPGKIVSDTEPTTRFKGLTWKYSGTADLTASDGTVIKPNTEYYYNGTRWMINYLSANNIEANSITADLIDAKNLTITDGEFISKTTNGTVTTKTEIKDNHITISKTDGTVNTTNDIALDPEQGLAQKFTNNATGFYRTAGINYQGPFTSDSDGNYAQLTPQGTNLSTDVPWTNLTLASGFSIGSGGKARYRVKNGVLYIHFRKIVCPSITGNQPNTLCYVPTNGRASDGYDSFGVMSATNSTRIQYNDSGDGKVAIVPASNTTAGQGFNGFLICPMD
ncbi:phage tail protein [Lactococcus lactis]|uniref:phage tail protein n=1 Tax=Lactococcus lactis TaxID=1358 RepID=UPI00072528D8|nr:phage tail protein [Lactococcus lactis]KSU03263.1 Phage tail assembly [Lactococcus lactis subsp. lactis]